MARALLHAAVFGMTDVLDLLVQAGAGVHSLEEAAAVGDVTGWLTAETPLQMRIRALVMAADLCFLTAILQAINFAIGYSLQKRLRQVRDETEQSGILEAKTDRPQLNKADTRNLAQPSSVTESTTELLEPVPRVMERKK